jgi:outer membrane receptor for ferrienterochelin and colicin
LGFLIMAHDGLLRSLNEAEQKTKVTRMQLSTDTRIGERNEAQLAVFRSSELTKYEEPFLKTRSDLDRYGGLLDLSLPGTPAGDVTCGGGFVKDELSCEDAVSSWSPAMGAGYLFACSSFKTGGWLNSLVSLRGDFHSDYGNELSPCGSLWHERGQTVLWFSFGRGFNPPTMNDLFWPEQTSSWEDTSGVKWTFVTKGNDRLKPESSWMGELGSRFSLLGGAIRGSATCYASRTEDFIEWGFSVNTSDSTVTYCEPVNVEQVDALGAELTLDFARGGESLARLNVSLQNVEDQDGVAVPYMPRSRCNLWLARSIEPFPELTMTLSVDATYLGECTEPGNSRQGPFFLVEQKLSGSIAGFTAFVRLRNVTDEVYPSRYPKPGEPGVYFPMPGRTYEIGFLWKLVD